MVYTVLMHFCFRHLIVSFSLLLFCGQAAHAGLIHDSELSWVTAESEHFRIHYHDGEKALADKSLQISETVYQRLTPILDWYPQERTEIVLSDETDFSNGFATPLPSNRMTLFVSRPHQVSSLEDHADWLETLILHEFVHILHLDKAWGEPKNIRRIFGRFPLLFPNAFMPPWMHEGLATYFETDKQLGIGRGQSSYFEMMMRLEVASGVKPLRQINQLIVTWPLLTSRYLYGVYFYQFIADTYGAETIPELVQSYSDHLIPFRINDWHEAVLGKDLSTLWDEYQVYLEQKFKPQLQQLAQEGVVQGEALTQTGDFKRAVVAAADGRIFFVRDHLQTGTDLVELDVNGKAKVIEELHHGANMDWHESAGFLVAQPEYCNNANIFYDLYRFDISKGEQTRLTHCQRYIFAAWSADGSKMAAVKNNRGQHALHVLNAKGQLQQILWQGKNGETLSGIDWSADGKFLLSSVWREGSGWNVEEFDVAKKVWRKRTSNALIKTNARYVKDTRDIVFSMDADGVYNIYRLTSETNKLSRLTQVLGGAFAPFITQDNQLLSIDYNASGFDVSELKQPASKAAKSLRVEDTLPKSENMHIKISAPIDYSPWQSLKPTAWFPSFLLMDRGAEIAAVVSGTDVLNRHTFTLFAGYQSVSQSPVFALDYVYDRWLPLLKLHAEQRETPSFDANNKLVTLGQKKRLNIELVFPFLQEETRWSAHIALSHQSYGLSWLHPAYTSTSGTYQDSLLGMALVYDGRESYSRSVSNVSDGSLWSVLFESGALFNGNYSGQVTTLSGREYFDLSNEQVLALRADVGLGSGQSRPFYLGGTLNNQHLPNLVSSLQASTAFNKRRYSLRGYGEGEVALIGSNMGLVSAEYRFPIARIERGWMAPPIGIDQVYGQVFMDAGHAWDNSFSQSKTYVGIGAELGVDMVLFYRLPMRLQLGQAKGLDNTIGGNQTYIRLGSSF